MPIGITFRATVENLLAINVDVGGMVADTVMAAHVGDMAEAEDNIFQKLILIGLTPYMKNVAADNAVHKMALDMVEERIDCYIMLH